MISVYHISLSAIQETDYIPRHADDRVGHFITMYQDYTDILRASPYIRYINRWDLKKKIANFLRKYSRFFLLNRDFFLKKMQFFFENSRFFVNKKIVIF